MRRKNGKLAAGVIIAAIAAMMAAGCSGGASAPSETAAAEVPSEAADEDTVTIQLLSTSDIHGKYLPYDYALNMEDTSGSMAQIETVVKELKNDNTILLDMGDSIQANFAELFLNAEQHPFTQGLNQMDYDVWVLGNHEFNFGVDTLKNIMSQPEAEVLCGNVYNPDGSALAEGHTVIEKNGVRVGIIGLVTPNITRWDSANLQGYTVTNPVDEAKKAIQEMEGKADVLVAAVHMSENNEYDVYGSGANDLAEACPELDVILAAHGHKKVEGVLVNGVLITENTNSGKTLSQVELTMKKEADGGYSVADKTSRLIETAEYEADQDMTELLAWADAEAKEEANKVIGALAGGSLAPENEIAEIPQARIEETPLIDLINEVQRYYTGADISASALFVDDANVHEGEIRKCDLAQIYKYENTLYKLEITGKQLRDYMEWTASYYNTWQPGDLTISFHPDMPGFNYDMFSGIQYEVNIAKEPGSRIENLRREDGTPIADEDVFTIAVNNYRANSQLLTYGEVFQEGEELPKLLEMDVRGELGGVRELIGDYIQNVLSGTLTVPELTGNWKIVGNDWDEAKHQEVVTMLANGTLSYETLDNVEDGKSGTVRSITEADLEAAAK